MSHEDIHEARNTRTALWAAACRREITVEQLYAELAALRSLAGDDLYPRIIPMRAPLK